MTGPRDLPPVDALAAQVGAPRAVAVAAARAVLAERRAELLQGATGDADLGERARAWAQEAERPRLRRVLNATGVIVHTNLGRAPLAAAARAAVARATEGYSNLELDLDTGARGSRHDHVAGLLCELTGAEAAIAVNNCAGATLLAAAALAGPDREVIVSRGQLVEIGGGFRVPDVIAQAGARLVEVGTTNRTRRADYERAIGADTGAILRAHPSNFRQLGFVQEVEIEELCELGVPVIDDVGSGVLGDELELLREEPAVRRSVRAGAALVCFSGDKLLGGPQAGVIVGRTDAVAAARAHPLARALRLDKLGLAALEATLQLYRDPHVAPARDPGAGDADRRRAGVARARGAAGGGDRRGGDRRRRDGAGRRRRAPAAGAARPGGRGRAAGRRRRRAGRAAARRRPARRRPDRGRAAAARPAHAGRRRDPARRPRVPMTTLGTAGHIDHGKTALVRALTGVDTDRLPEERERGISIALGYAPLTLPSGRTLSVVDVPGHERFVRTMVAGATGIDLYLMTVAADDGVMPQTREHAAVLAALGVEIGAVAITKADLADPERAAAEAAALLPGTEVVAVSARTGAGLDALRAALDRAAARAPDRADSDGGLRVHVDRVFTIRGSGTVVTGTLWSGSVGRGDEVTIQPAGLRARVRGGARSTTRWSTAPTPAGAWRSTSAASHATRSRAAT